MRGCRADVRTPRPDGGRSAERLRNSASGLAASLRLSGTGTQEPSWDRLPLLRSPVLALAGADDIRFASTRCASLASSHTASRPLSRAGGMQSTLRSRRRPPDSSVTGSRWSSRDRA